VRLAGTVVADTIFMHSSLCHITEQLFCQTCYYDITKSYWGTLQLFCYVSYNVCSSCAHCHQSSETVQGECFPCKGFSHFSCLRKSKY